MHPATITARHRPWAFVLGRLDERAGVHHHHVGVGGVAAHEPARLGRGAQNALGIHLVLGTAEADQADRVALRALARHVVTLIAA
jgi:hypothetical protein